jgi:hypothetical protein
MKELFQIALMRRDLGLLKDRSIDDMLVHEGAVQTAAYLRPLWLEHVHEH